MDTSLPADPTNTDQNPGTSGGSKGDRDEEVVVTATADSLPADPTNSDQNPGTSGGGKSGRNEPVVPTTAAAPENPDQGPKSPQGPKGERTAVLSRSTDQ